MLAVPWAAPGWQGEGSPQQRLPRGVFLCVGCCESGKTLPVLSVPARAETRGPCVSAGVWAALGPGVATQLFRRIRCREQLCLERPVLPSCPAVLPTPSDGALCLDGPL